MGVSQEYTRDPKCYFATPPPPRQKKKDKEKVGGKGEEGEEEEKYKIREKIGFIP